MIYRRLIAVSAVLGVLTFAACGSEPPAEPEPPGDTAQGIDLDSLQRYNDSVAAAEAERQRLLAEMERNRANARAVLEQRVHFEYDQSRITPEAQSLLQQKLAILRASPGVQIRLEGHADERGSVEYNQALGNRRAQSVLDFFSQNGLQAGGFQTTSFGEERPISMGSTEAAWAQNRRVEFVIIAGGDQINPAD